MSECLKFCTGIEIEADFYSEMSICRYEPGVAPPPTIPTLYATTVALAIKQFY